MDIFRLLNEIKASSRYQNQIVHIEEIPASEALYASLELKTKVKAALSELGIEDLYSHQTEAIDKIREGKNIVLCTTTASGKSLTYLVPIFETVLDDPEATALYISPLNALVNDQLKVFVEFEETLRSGAGIARYTGALSEFQKRKVREGQKNIVFTNPEMVHMSFLAWHHLWGRFFSNLKFIVVDESPPNSTSAAMRMVTATGRVTANCAILMPYSACCYLLLPNTPLLQYAITPTPPHSYTEHPLNASLLLCFPSSPRRFALFVRRTAVCMWIRSLSRLA